jgi:hypothetical protein
MPLRDIKDLVARGVLRLDNNGRISYPHPWEQGGWDRINERANDNTLMQLPIKNVCFDCHKVLEGTSPLEFNIVCPHCGALCFPLKFK